jgi:hypothetical protein
MSKDQDRTVSRRADGTWENKRNDAERASSLHKTQKEAIDSAKEMLIKQGGGELITKGVDGKIRSKDTVAPGNDPRGYPGFCVNGFSLLLRHPVFELDSKPV